jgi:hypothetical protein
MRGAGTPGATSNRHSSGDRAAPLRTARNFSPACFVFSRVRNDPPSSTREAGGPGAHLTGADVRWTAEAPETPQTAAKGPESSRRARPHGVGAQGGAQRRWRRGAPSSGVGRPRGWASPPPAPCSQTHSYATPRHIVVEPKRHGAGPRTPWAVPGPHIPDPAYRLRRMVLTRSRVNRVAKGCRAWGPGCRGTA